MSAAPAEPRPVVWVDGRLRPRREAAVRVDDSAFAEARGCYTSVRISGGRPERADRHLRRLARGARALGLPPADESALRAALRELARAAFDGGDGIVRIQLSRDADGGLHVTAVPRGLGPDAPVWTAVTAPFPHPGALLAGGHKLTSRLAMALAGDAARDAGADEALLFDAAGRLVEGARSNVLALTEAGEIVTPPAERGAVAGVALEVVLERLPAVRRRDLSAATLRRARGVVALNAVRGARPLACLDGAPLGEEGPALAKRLETALASERVR